MVWILAARLRRTLARPVVRRAVVVAVAAATALAVISLVRSVEQAGDRWGTTTRVVVAEQDLLPGDTVESGDVSLRDLPAGAVADAALRELPVGAVVRQPVAAGEPLVAERLAPDGLSGVAALVPPGHRAVAVPVGPGGVPPLRVGDRVDVLAVLPSPADAAGHPEDLAADDFGGARVTDGTDGIDETEGSGNDAGSDVGYEGDTDSGRASAPPVVPIVESAIAVDVGEQAVTIAVPLADAPTVAYALTQAVVILTLAGA